MKILPLQPCISESSDGHQHGLNLGSLHTLSACLPLPNPKHVQVGLSLNFAVIDKMQYIFDKPLRIKHLNNIWCNRKIFEEPSIFQPFWDTVIQTISSSSSTTILTFLFTFVIHVWFFLPLAIVNCVAVSSHSLMFNSGQGFY